MKRSLFLILFVFLFLFISNKSFATTDFINALNECSNYSKTGSINYQGQKFDLLITLKKNRRDKCIYKEKIFQDKSYQMLTCSFDESQLAFIKDSMTRYSDMFSKQIKMNPIFEAKLTTNGEVFQKYLVDQNICQITFSKR